MEENAFQTLKSKLMTQPLLKFPDLSKPFEVHCDACGDNLGAVLLQEGHPIAYTKVEGLMIKREFLQSMKKSF